MQIINFINPNLNRDIYELLVTCSTSGFLFDQTSRILKEKGYFITKEQYEAFNVILDEMLELDIGEKQHLIGKSTSTGIFDDFTN